MKSFKCRIQRFVAALVWLSALNAGAISPANPPPLIVPGLTFIHSGECDKLLPLIQGKDEFGSTTYIFDWWSFEIQKLVVENQLKCLDKFPLEIQHEMYLRAAAIGHSNLFKAWMNRGGDLNTLRTTSESLATAAAKSGNVSMLEWLKSAGLRPLDSDDIANELAVAPIVVVSNAAGASSAVTAYEWLLSNGYSWPSHPAAAHNLLSRLASQGNYSKFQDAVTQFSQNGDMSRLTAFDSNESVRPLIFLAKNPEDVQLMNSIGFNVHAKQIDRKTKIVVFPSALFNHQLTAPTQRALLALKVSALGRDRFGYAPLAFALAYNFTDLDLIERYLIAGADVLASGSLQQDDPIHQIARIRSNKISAEQLKKLIVLLVKYGANISSVRVNDGRNDLTVGNLPIHTAIFEGNTPFFKIWMKESGVTGDVKHPKSGLSLVGYALQLKEKHRTMSDSAEIVAELVRLGAPINDSGGSVAVNVISSQSSPDLVLMQKLLDLGIDINAVDAQTGLTALAILVNRGAYITSAGGGCPSSVMTRCANETREQRLQLIRWFMARGARPDYASHSGKSALTVASEITDTERRKIYMSTLTEKIQ
jgi:hypothetical protein